MLNGYKSKRFNHFKKSSKRLFSDKRALKPIDLTFFKIAKANKLP